MSFFSRRTIAAVAIATVASFPLIGSTAQAHETSAKKSTHSHSKQVKKVKKVKKFHAKFVVVGTVKAVDENSITVTVKGGNLKKGLRGTDVVVSVNETTKITAEDAPKTLADVLVGDRVAVKGTRAVTEGVTTYTAKRVHVKHPETKTESTTAATPTATGITS